MLADWEANLGPRDLWAPVLKSAANQVIKSRVPMLIGYGPELLLLFNSPFAALLGSDWKSTLGRSMPEVWAPAWDVTRPLIERVLLGEGVFVENVPLLTQRSGYTETGYFSFSYTPLEADGKVEGTLCVCVETTAAVLANREVDILKSELIHLSRVSAMETMASSLAHELNQPLAAICGFAWGAEQYFASDAPDREAKIREALVAITKGARRASAIINRTRERVKRTGRRVSAVDVAVIVHTSHSLVTERAKAAEARIELLLPQLPLIAADALQIEQVLVNLLQNSIEAVEGTAERRITVSAVEDEKFVRVSVEDSGPGIDPTRQEQLFQPFATTKTSGLGVGLAISRTIVEDHGGSLWVEERDKGACFSFSVPTVKP
jgi:signal transduction histidine kinase